MEYIQIKHLCNKNIHVTSEEKELWNNTCNKNAYKEIHKLEPYLYETYYGDLAYDYAMNFFKTKKVPVSATSCSAMYKDGIYGRNLDWNLNHQAEFIVHTSHENGRNATIGICSSLSGLNEDVVDTYEYSELYKIVPFMLVDGINEHGLTMNTNVVPANEKYNIGDNYIVNKLDNPRIEICSLMLIRYVLDNFATVTEAINYLKNFVTIYQPTTLLQTGYEQHFMIADKNEVRIIEFIGGNIIDIAPDKAIMANFHVSGTIYNEDYNVNTPYTGNVSMNHITPHGAGLERHNILNTAYNNVDSVETMGDAMKQVYYTNAYKTTDDKSSKFYTEFVGMETADKELLTVNSSVDAFDGVYNDIAARFKSYKDAGTIRDRGTFWQTVHSVIYDINNLTMHLAIQEGDYNYIRTFN